MHPVVSHSTRPLVRLPALLLIVAACGRGSSAGRGDSGAAVQNPPAANVDTMATLRGTVASVSAGEVVLKTDTSTVTVKVSQPFRIYDRAPSDLSRVTNNSFIGVTTVKRPDGSEQATEIHIFPDELRGLGEGSRMMTPDASVSSRRMTNGNVSASRMSNGTVASAAGSTLVVQYPGGSQDVTVPTGTPVTEIKPVSKQLVPGDRVVVIAKRQRDGSLSSSKALIAAK